MPRTRRKAQAETQAPALDAIPDTSPPAPQPLPESSDQQKKWTDQGPRGSHTIDLGDGRKARFLRSNQWQQNQIRFVSLAEDGDPRPKDHEKEIMKAAGYHWRKEEMAWTRQFFTRDDKEHIEAVEREKGKDEAQRLRSRIRQDSDRAAQAAFVEMANATRIANGLEPTSYQMGNDQAQGR